MTCVSRQCAGLHFEHHSAFRWLIFILYRLLYNSSLPLSIVEPAWFLLAGFSLHFWLNFYMVGSLIVVPKILQDAVVPALILSWYLPEFIWCIMHSCACMLRCLDLYKKCIANALPFHGDDVLHSWMSISFDHFWHVQIFNTRKLIT